MNKKIVSLFMIITSILFLTGCSLSIFTPNPYAENLYTEPTTIETGATLDERVRQIAKDYVDAVVTVFVVDTEGTEVSFGSGVGIYEGGYIVTNYHVISSVVEQPTMYSLEVYYNESQIAYDAEILWSHFNLDLAIIKSENSSLPFVEMQDRFIDADAQNMLVALETVVAIGTPLDFSLQNSVTLGYVSSVTHRMSFADDNVYEDLIQHTAPINHGNSGGALFDSYGKLVGLNTLGNDDANSIFFSVPIYPIMLVLDDVVAAYEADGSSYSTPKMGINAVDQYQAEYVEGVTFDDDGMFVVSVGEGASNGKLQANDIITALTVGAVTYDITIRNDLIFALLHAQSGQIISVSYVRGGVSNSVNITLE